MRRTALVLSALLVLGLLTAPPSTADVGENITHVDNLRDPFANAQGTDSMFVEMDLDPTHPSPVWYYAYCDEAFVCLYPSIAGLLRATADAVDVAGLSSPGGGASLTQAYSAQAS